MNHRTHRAVGFTLVELLVVTVVIGILAGVVISLFSNTADDAQKTAFLSSGRNFSQSALRYQLDNGEPLEDASSGVLPSGFDTYVVNSNWGSTPIGGVWDTELNSYGVTSALGVHFNGEGATRDDTYMTQVDQVVDDGDLTTGAFRKLDTDRYYFVLED